MPIDTLVWACHRQQSVTTASQGRRAQRGAQRAPDAVVQSAAPVTGPNDRYKEARLYGSEGSECERHWEGGKRGTRERCRAVYGCGRFRTQHSPQARYVPAGCV